jgi:hypothetical protein
MKTFFLAAAAALVAAAPAAAQDPAPAPTPTSFYFDCTSDAPLTNAGDGGWTWSPTAPTAPLASGAGCLTVDTYIGGTAPQNFVYDAVFGGAYKGEVKQLDVVLYGVASSPLGRALSVAPKADVRVEVNGELVFNGDGLVSTSEPSGNGPGGVKATWTVPELSVPAGTRAKDFVITVGNVYTDDVILWGRGASDFPSGVVLYDALDLPPAEDEGV